MQGKQGHSFIAIETEEITVDYEDTWHGCLEI